MTLTNVMIVSLTKVTSTNTGNPNMKKYNSSVTNVMTISLINVILLLTCTIPH